MSKTLCRLDCNKEQSPTGQYYLGCLLYAAISRCPLLLPKVQFKRTVELLSADFRHYLFKRFKILLHRLVNKNVAIREKKDFLLCAGLPKPVNNLKRRVGFAGARRHNKQNAILSASNCFNGAVYRHTLIITRGYIAYFKVVWFGDEFFLFRRYLPLPFIPRP